MLNSFKEKAKYFNKYFAFLFKFSIFVENKFLLNERKRN